MNKVIGSLGDLPPSLGYLLGGITLFLSVTMIIENVILLIVLCRNKEFRTPSYKILTSLVVSDLMNGALATPCMVAMYFQRAALAKNNDLTGDDFNALKSLYTAMMALLTTSIASSTLTIGLIAVDKCFHLIRLNRYTMNPVHMYLGLGICWGIPVVMIVILLNEGWTIFVITILVLGVICLLTTICSYIGVIVALRIYSKRSPNQSSSRKAERQAGGTVIIILSLLIITLIPYFVTSGIWASGTYGPRRRLKLWENIACVIMVSNSAMNPLIQFFRNKKIAKHVRQLISCRIHTNESDANRPTEAENEWMEMNQTNLTSLP